MTREEFGRLAAAIKTYYSKEDVLVNDHAMELWYQQLKDLDYKISSIALSKWVATNKWSPTIADLRETYAGIRYGEPMSWSEGWDRTVKAIKKYGYMRETEALESLDETTREVVKRLGYFSLCASENLSADRANFRMVFEQIAQKRKTDELIPSGIKKLVKQMTKDMITDKHGEHDHE